MTLNPIILAIPVYFVLIVLEWIISLIKHKGWYRLNDAIGNIGCGITEQITGVFIKVIGIGVYTLIFEKFRLFDIPHTWYWAVVLFIGVDFLYYWAHRMSHEINLFWVGHVVHHQSEEYNFSVALRQGTFQKVFMMPFYWPLAFVGFDPYWFLFIGAFTTLYQFWIHTEGIDKMGWFEYLFNTPSHHRVHHGRDPIYIDRNHGGTFIIWDRLFGTFQEEIDRPHYGITKPVRTFNPVLATLIPIADFAREIGEIPGFGNKLLAVFHPPGWWALSRNIERKKKPQDFSKFDFVISKNMAGYAILHFFIILLLSAAFLFNYVQLSVFHRIGAIVFLLFSMYSIGNILDKNKMSKALESARLVVVGIMSVLLVYTYTIPRWMSVIFISLSLINFVSLLWLLRKNSENRERKNIQI